jgi:hypothetical protein
MADEKDRVVVDELAHPIEKLRVSIRVALIVIGSANEAPRPVDRAMDFQ